MWLVYRFLNNCSRLASEMVNTFVIWKCPFIMHISLKINLLEKGVIKIPLNEFEKLQIIELFSVNVNILNC